MRHLDFLQRQLEKRIGSEVAGGGEDFQQTQPKTKNPIVEQGDLLTVVCQCMLNV